MSFHSRSDTLIELLEELTQAGDTSTSLSAANALSAFNVRFSANLDIQLKAGELKDRLMRPIQTPTLLKHVIGLNC